MSKIVEEEYQCVVCVKCRTKFYIEKYLYLTSRRRGENFTLWCPNGHKQYFEIQDVVDEPDGPDGEVVKFQVIKGDLE